MLMSIVMKKVQTWLSYRETVFELESLGERELSDLGIGRRDIKRVALQAANAAHLSTGSAQNLVPAHEA
ncbi:DUF1127 domain-containing protein [Microvirga antarctica]|uniref:DUF1127 domain-containing protein n=1 Tax=Microvirga antarctica TaxID=2819233 RepID=UPI0031BB688F